VRQTLEIAERLVDIGVDAIVDHRFEERVERLEMVLQRSERHPGSLRDLAHRKGAEALIGEHLRRQRREFFSAVRFRRVRPLRAKLLELAQKRLLRVSDRDCRSPFHSSLLVAPPYRERCNP